MRRYESEMSMQDSGAGPPPAASLIPGLASVASLVSSRSASTHASPYIISSLTNQPIHNRPVARGAEQMIDQSNQSIKKQRLAAIPPLLRPIGVSSELAIDTSMNVKKVWFTNFWFIF